MLYMFPGSIAVENIDFELKAFSELLREERLDRVSDLYISTHGWRNGERCQIVNDSGRIAEIIFDPIPSSTVGVAQARVRRPGVAIRDRPSDMPFNPLAIMFGHDD